MKRPDTSDIVVHHTVEVKCFANEYGDVWFSREPHEWEGGDQVRILIPRAYVPGLIAHLQTLMAESD